MTAGLLDTNILVYANNLDAPFHEPCRKLVEEALDGRFPAYIAHQNLLELYAVFTDKRRVEKPISPQAANDLICFYLADHNISIIYPTSSTFSILGELILNHAPHSHGIFDLMLVALMKEHGIPVIHTANVRHFTDFPGIIPINPIEK